MSLLMDALKKAELAKRQGQAGLSSDSTDAAAPASALTLEPIPDLGEVETAAATPVAPATKPSAGLPQLPSHLEELDDQFLADVRQAASERLKTAAPAAARASLSERPAAVDQPALGAAPALARQAATERDAAANKSSAQNLFAAKQANKQTSPKAFAITIGIFTAVAVCAIGGYFWWQLQPKSTLIASRTPMPQPASALSPAATATVSPAPIVAVDASTKAPGAAGAPGTTRSPTQIADEKGRDDAALAPTSGAGSRRATPPAATPIEAEGPIRVTKAPLKVDPALMRGFEAFNRGDFAAAQSEYERARKSDPRNTDALHGLAAIAVRQGRLDQAEWLYRQITEADPQDAIATTALINMRGQLDPVAAESRLKILAAAQPELAAPHFSLGNLYARHGRWSEAQQSYFRAYGAEPDNPDILYNLAISLEHLRQDKLAAQYYTQAIAAAQNRPAGFDRNQATTRLRGLLP